MKSPIIILASLLLLISITSCDPLRPIYRDIDGDWEVASITISDRTSLSGDALADTSVNVLAEFSFDLCDRNANDNANCTGTLTTTDGGIFDINYQVGDAEEPQMILSVPTTDLKESSNPFGTYDLMLEAESITLTTKPNTSELIASSYRGRTLTITLNRK
ncbi:MAG: hypothetical protein AAFQ68_26510 [Bacteroidota bacterium]